MKNIKAIIFDAYGTLFDVNSAAEKCKDKIGDKWEGFANYWRTTQLEYTWLRSLMNKHKDFWQVTEDSLDKSMKASKIDPSMRNELFRFLFSSTEHHPRSFYLLLPCYLCAQIHLQACKLLFQFLCEGGVENHQYNHLYFLIQIHLTLKKDQNN